jgi:hypothetical protein
MPNRGRTKQPMLADVQALLVDEGRSGRPVERGMIWVCRLQVHHGLAYCSSLRFDVRASARPCLWTVRRAGRGWSLPCRVRWCSPRAGRCAHWPPEARASGYLLEGAQTSGRGVVVTTDGLGGAAIARGLLVRAVRNAAVVLSGRQRSRPRVAMPRPRARTTPKTAQSAARERYDIRSSPSGRHD